MWWPDLAFKAANWLWFLLGMGALAFALSIIVLHGQFLDRAANSFKRSGFAFQSRAAFLVLGIGVPVAVVTIKMAQHLNFQLTSDSAHVMNYGWNAIHGYGLYSSPYGLPFLGIHFQLMTPIISPLLLLWNHVFVYVIIHGLALGSTVFGVYLLTKRRSQSAVLPWLMALLTIAHPCFRNLMCTIIEDSVFAAPLFIWTVYCFEEDRPWLAFLFLGLFLTTKEEATATLCGIGLYLLCRRQKKPILGAGLVIAAVGLAVVEVTVITKMRNDNPCVQGFGFFAPHLGKSLKEIAWNSIHRPWIFPAALVYPVSNFWPGIYNLFFAGLFPLMAGAAILPLYLAWIPHQLADHPHFHWLLGYYGGFVFGPMLWAMVIGAARLWRRLAAGRRRIFAAYVLLVSALGFFMTGANNYNSRLMPSTWKKAVPKAAALIRPDSKLWCESYLLPNFALRHYIKWLPRNLPDCNFESDLFMPDQVLLSAYWPRLADKRAVERIMGFLRRQNFEIVFQEADLILLERKGAAYSVPGRESVIRLDPSDF